MRPARLDLSVLPKPKFDLRLAQGPSPCKGGAFGKSQAGYSIAEAVGCGSTAVVKRARREADGCQVALKCVRSRDEEVQDFLRQEYNILRSLRHDSIVRVDALHECGNFFFMVMEFCDDGDVMSYVTRHGKLGEGRAAALMRQLLGAVSHLHQKRIVHRDLKPANLLLTQCGEVLKVSDFNSAKVVGNAVEDLMLTERGTRAYCAPELLLGHDWNERVDIWASGLCLYFMVCGELPFNSVSQRVKGCFAAGKLPKLEWTQDGDGPSRSFRDLICQCLVVSANERPPAMKLLVHPAVDVKEPLGPVRTAIGHAPDVAVCGPTPGQRCRRAAAVRDDLVEMYKAATSSPSGSRPRSRSMPRLFGRALDDAAGCCSPDSTVIVP